MAFLAILMFNLAEELLITTLRLQEAECFEGKNVHWKQLMRSPPARWRREV
jgi:hypothetical protein